jgi:VCBS repeat-containing protein
MRISRERIIRRPRATTGLYATWLVAGLLFAQQAGAWPDLRIVKSGPAQAGPGDILTYTLSYTNVGPVRSTSVVMKDFLPANTTALTNTLNGGTLSGSTISWSLGTLNSSARGSRSFQVRINSNAPAPGAITNRSQIFGSEAEETGKTNDNYSTWITTLISNNRAPVAQDDAYTIAEDMVLTVSAPGILANDADPDGNTLSAILSASPTNGTLTLGANGSLTYRPNTNFNGFDYFTYRANDGKTNSGIATVTICVTPANDFPVARDDQYMTPEDTVLTISAPGVLGNDTDADGDPLTAIIVTQPGNGQVSLSANGGFAYTPNTNFNGADLFTYRANDGAANSGIATVTITVTPVNDPPVARNDAYTVNENSVLTINAPGVLANDSDAEGSALTAILASGPTNGVLSLNANGGFIYTPNTNYNGADTFSYRANDGVANSGVAIVSLTVFPVNYPPVAQNDQYSTPEDTALVVFAPGALVNDTDSDNDALTAILATGPSNGVLTLNSNGGFAYTPSTNFNGVDSFTYRASDGITNSQLATVTITVIGTNDVPIARNDQYFTPEDTALVITVPGVLANDSDPDGDLLTTILETSPANGLLILNPDGSFTFTPSTNFSGIDSFTYRASDGQLSSEIATVTITVSGLNDPPVVQDDRYSVLEDSLLDVSLPGVLANDSDPDGDGLTANIVTGVTNGSLTLNLNGSFTYLPYTNYNGIDGFTYRANDGQTNSGIATVTIIVIDTRSGTNDPPVALNDQYTTPEDTALVIPLPGVLANDSDPDNDPLRAVLVDNPAQGTLLLNINGSFAYTPNTNFSGVDTFTYRANDGDTNSNLATVTITVVGTNDAPIARDDQYSTPEDTVLVIAAPGVLANDSDPDGDVLATVIASLPANGWLILNLNGGFTYTPNTNFSGVDSFTYRASDGSITSQVATVTITVVGANDPPVARDDHYTTPEDTSLVVVAPGVLANDSDPDGNILSTLLPTTPIHGTLVLNVDGDFTYTPQADFHGVDVFTYRASDGITNSEIATVTITVVGTNDAPVAQNDQYTTPENTVLVVTALGVLTNDNDVDGDVITAILAGSPTNGLLTLSSNGGFTYTPNTNFNGLDSFTYRANDGQTDSGLATVTINVTPVNQPPNTNNWTGKSFTTYEDTVLNVAPPGVLRGIVDAHGNLLKALLLRRITNGVLNLALDGSFQLTPLTNFNGVDAFEFIVSDDFSNSVVLNVDITVLPVNDPPSFVKGGNFRLPQSAGPQVITNWATGISPGPADESGQLVTFQVSNDNNAHFSAQPALTPSGTLTFTPAPGASGSITVTVLARDDGGTANGGADTSAPQTFSITLNTPPTVQIVSPTNGASFFAPGSFTVLADAQDVDGTVTNVQFFSGTNKLAEMLTEPFYTMLTNLPVGSYTFGALATDDFGATGSATPVTINVIERPPLTYLTSVYYNPQKDFFEQRVRVTNPTYSVLNAVRVLVLNLTNVPAITVGNRSGTTNGIPYVQSYAAIPPGGYIDLTIEYLSPMRIMPSPILRAELVPPAGPQPPLSGSFQHINRGVLLANHTYLVEFNTQSNRVYAVQYSDDLVHWKTAQPALAGEGSWIQWIDNGEPKTEGSPAAAAARFYRLLLLP